MNNTNIQEVENLLNTIINKTNNIKPIMYTMGEKLHSKSMEAFEKERDPVTGTPWSPISATSLFAQTSGKKKSKIKSGKRHTKAFLRKATDKRILQIQGIRGGLMGSIDYTASGNSLEFIAAKEYAATHFFGDSERNIKQRRYMPFTNNLDLDNKTTDEILEDIGNFIIGD